MRSVRAHEAIEVRGPGELHRAATLGGTEVAGATHFEIAGAVADASSTATPISGDVRYGESDSAGIRLQGGSDAGAGHTVSFDGGASFDVPDDAPTALHLVACFPDGRALQLFSRAAVSTWLAVATALRLDDTRSMRSKSGLAVHVGIVMTLLVACASSGAAGGATGTDASAGGTTSGGGNAASGGSSGASGGRVGASGGNGGSGGAGGGASGASGGGASGATIGSCATDPLHTGETPPDGDDEFDCAILAATAKYGEPDAMIFKAIIHTESRFAIDATACPNLPCGTPSGWTAAESGCYGLMQIVPACQGPNKEGLLPSGHPNLTTDTTSPDWPTSIFNPSVNIDVGVYGVNDNRKQVKKQFSGCTEDQYTLMAIGNYNSYGSTKSCTVYNTAYDDAVLTTYREYAQKAGWPAHAY